MFDAVIIGAGPAGSTAALAMAHLGRRVALVEQHQTVREKVCGECLSSVGIDALRQLNIASRIQSLQPAIHRRTVIHAQDGDSCVLPLPREMWGISRSRLDSELLESARDAGVIIVQPGRCEKVNPGEKPSAIVRDLRDNSITTLQGRFILVADGKANGSKSPREFGVKAHFENVQVDPNAIHLFGLKHHYGGLAAIEGVRWNAAFSVPAAIVRKFEGDLDSMMREILTANRELEHLLDPARGARRIGGWLAAPLPRFAVGCQWPRNVIPIGNAAAALEPIGGEGMGLAMHSGILASQWIEQSLLGKPADVEILRGQFRKLWSRRSTVCRLMAISISRSLSAQVVVAGARAGSGLNRLVMRGMGKSDSPVQARFAGVSR